MRSTTPILFLLAFMSASHSRVFAQPQRDLASSYVHHVWTAEDGLPVNSATSIIQSRDGYLWIGTWQGLVRFDGADFAVYDSREIDGLQSSRITSLYEDDAGAIWIGTTNGGLARFQDGRFTTHTTEAGLGGDYVIQVHEGLPGEILVQYSHGRTRRIVQSDDEISFEELGVPGEGHTRVVRFDAKTGDVWIALARGLLHVTDTGVDTVKTEDGLISDEVSAVEMGPDGSIWVGMKGGAARIMNGRITPFHIPTSTVSGIDFDSEGQVWLRASSVGLVVMQNDRPVVVEFERDPIGSNPEALLFDREGSLWVGTTGTGLHRLRRPLFHSFGEAEGIRVTQFLGIAEDSVGNIWAGTSRDGVIRLGADGARRFTVEDGIPDLRVWAATTDHRGLLWVGTTGGPAYFDGRRFQTVPSIRTPGVRALQTLSDGRVVYGGYRSIGEVRRDGLIDFAANDALTDNAWAIVEGDEDTLWIGTEASGLCLFAGAFECLNISDRPEHRAVRSIVPISPGRLWLGTYGGGLCQWSSGNLKCLTERDGLPDGTVHSIVTDGRGYVWLSSNAGVFRYGTSVLEKFFDGDTTGIYPDHFGRWDGMPSSETNGGFQPSVLRSTDGRLWYPTTTGITVVDPAGVPAPRSPTPRIDQLTIDGKPVELGDRLPAGSDRLVFEFSAVNLVSPRESRFRYKLEGHEARWLESGPERTAVYTNLGPGSFLLRIQASSGSGPWIETAYAFEIAPFFYQTVWFLVLVVLCGIALAGIGYDWRIRALKRRQLELEAIVEERTAQLTELDRAKNRFFANISHEFRTPLQMILGPLEQGVDWDDRDQSHRLRGLMRSNARRMLDLVNELLDLAKLESGYLVLEPIRGDLVAFVEELIRRFVPLAERNEVDLHFETSLPSLTCRFDPDRLDKAVGNVVANALKFTPRDGKVVVRLVLTGSDAIEIVVSDTGPGIDSKDADRIFDRFEQGAAEAPRQADGAGIGLALAREIMVLHGGSIVVESELGKGATFHLRFPLERDADDAPVERDPDHGHEEGVDPPPVSHGPRDRPIVLLVDDNHEVRALLRDFLRSDYEILEAPDGLTALHMARDRQPDLIVSDVMMPKMDGFDLVREIRNQPDLRTIPVIILTARASEESAIEGIDLGADNYLRKPVSAAELRARVTRLLEARQAMMERYLRQIRVAPANVTVDGADEVFLRSVISIIEADMGSESFTAERLAETLALSPRQLRRRLARTISESPARLIQRMRMERAVQLIEAGTGNVAEVARAVGFSDPSYFATAFKKHFGHAPSDHASESVRPE